MTSYSLKDTSVPITCNYTSSLSYSEDSLVEDSNEEATHQNKTYTYTSLQRLDSSLTIRLIVLEPGLYAEPVRYTIVRWSMKLSLKSGLQRLETTPYHSLYT